MDEGGGYDAREWITAREAMPLFGYKDTWNVIRACRNAGVEEKKVPNPHGGPNPLCLFRRAEVEELLEAREHEAWLKAQGMKRCSGCGEWKDEQEFWKGFAKCRLCGSEKNKEDWARTKARTPAQDHPWKQSGFGVEAAPGPVDDYVSKGAPPRATDSLKYACMGEGYSVKPIPIGSSKRKAFCPGCEAVLCFWHRELTPEQVMKLEKTPTLYPEMRVHSYVEGV